MTHSIISLGQRTALSALLHRANCQPDTLPTPPIKENLGVLLRTCVRGRRLSLYARAQRKTENAPYRGDKSGSCPPTVWRKVGLHKGFDAHKAWFSCPLPATFSGSPSQDHRRVSHADGHAVVKVQRAKRQQKSRHKTDQLCLRFFWKVMLVGYVTAESQDVQPRRV